MNRDITIPNSCGKYYIIKAAVVVLCLAALFSDAELVPGPPSAWFSLLILTVLFIGWMLARRFSKAC